MGKNASVESVEKYKVKEAGCFSPVKVDALEYLPDELDALLNELKAEEADAKSKFYPAAFVTFK